MTSPNFINDCFKQALKQLSEIKIFSDSDSWIEENNPYRRSIRPQVFKHLSFSKPLARQEVLDYHSMAANRILLTAYETEFVFLPETGFKSIQDDFQDFYSPETSTLMALVRPKLERFLFGFLETEIRVTGNWTADLFRQYAEEFISSTLDETEENKAMNAIVSSRNPTEAAKAFLIQLAGDFLVESSAMARNLPGSYGPIQSELFKVVIDEYGFGVHETKHSTLFEDVMKSVGLNHRPHAYWQFYLTSSLLLNNYFNDLCRNHSKFFRYMGAIFWAETTFIKTCADMAKMMRVVFGPTAEVKYFAEHAHIDEHHSRMALEKLVMASIKQHGNHVIEEIVRGIEEAKLLASIADDDFIRQIHWSDNADYYKSLAPQVHAAIDGCSEVPVQRIVEPRGELSVCHVHDGDELCWIESGTMKFVTGQNQSTLLHAGEGTVIEANRLHGAIIESEECVYHIHSIKDHKLWLS